MCNANPIYCHKKKVSKGECANRKFINGNIKNGTGSGVDPALGLAKCSDDMSAIPCNGFGLSRVEIHKSKIKGRH